MSNLKGKKSGQETASRRKKFLHQIGGGLLPHEAVMIPQVGIVRYVKYTINLDVNEISLNYYVDSKLDKNSDEARNARRLPSRVTLENKEFEVRYTPVERVVYTI